MGETNPKPAPDSKDPGWTTRHIWQIQPVRDVLTIAAVFLLLYLGYVTSVVTVPLLLAMALAYMVEPLVQLLTARRLISRPGAAVGFIALAVLGIVIPAIIAVGYAAVQGTRAVEAAARNGDWLAKSIVQPMDPKLRALSPGPAWDKIRDWAVEEKRRGEENEKARQALELQRHESELARIEKERLNPPDPSQPPVAPPVERDPPQALPQSGLVYPAIVWGLNWAQINGAQLGKQAISSGTDAFGWALRALSTIGATAFAAFLTAFFFFFACTGFGRLVAFWKSLIPDQSKRFTLNLLRQMDRVIASFIRGRLLICGCLMLYYTLAYWIVGVSTPIILGPIVGLLAIAPFIQWLGVPAAILLLWFDPAGGFRDAWWWVVFAPCVVGLLAQILDDYVLTPIIQGKNTGMDTPSILFAVMAGGALAGPFGLLIAIPAGACVKIILQEMLWPRFQSWAKGEASDFLPIKPG